MIKISTNLIDFTNKNNEKTTPVFKDYFFEPSQISLQNVLNFSKNLEVIPSKFITYIEILKS